MDTTYVKIHGTRIKIEAKTLPEAKLAVKELRFLKKEYGLKKREINEIQKAIRAKYTDEIRRRGSMFRGGGGIGRFVRDIQSAKRDSRREQLARSLAPYEKQKLEVESMIMAIDSLIIQAEAKIASLSR
jgi:hypothetical protein